MRRLFNVLPLVWLLTWNTQSFAADATPLCLKRQELTARAAGIVTSINKRSGDEVKSGDIIIALDDRILLAGLKEGEAALEVAKANEALAEDAFQRLQKLKSTAAISEQQKVESRLRLAQARAARAQAEAALERMRVQVADTQIRAEISGIVRGVPEIKGLFVQYGQSLGYIDGAKTDCGVTQP